MVGNIIRRSKTVKIVHLSTESLNKLTASNRLHLRVKLILKSFIILIKQKGVIPPRQEHVVENVQLK